MAWIIYKEGLEGQNRLECIEGIEIDLLNGQKALIYPKYSEEVLLDPKDRDRWLDAGISEMRALRLRDNQAATAALLKAGSPAARFATKFTSEKFGRFGLPTLLAAMEITEQKGEIDELARKIYGADLLEDFSCNLWSCSRCNTNGGWIASGNSGCADGYGLDGRNVAAPLVLLDVTADAFKKRTAGSVAPQGVRAGVYVLKYMELKDYTEEQLRAELKRRYDERQKERESIKRCRHCEYMQRFNDYDLYNCRVRTFTRKNRYDKNNPIVVHYSVKKSDKACDKFKQKENQDGK